MPGDTTDMDSVKLVVYEKHSQFLVICLFSVCLYVGLWGIGGGVGGGGGVVCEEICGGAPGIPSSNTKTNCFF